MTPDGDRPLVPELEGLLAKATPLPWRGGVLRDNAEFSNALAVEFDKHRGTSVGAITSGDSRFLAFLATTNETVDEDAANAALIVAAVNALPQLLALLKAAQADGERVARLTEALAWYGEQARLARLIHSEGDAGRNALQADGGQRARAALSEGSQS